ncbi:LysR family transcriptional regulator [Streptomyces toyocaensis]|uniref:LysR family transcriptional regulator n=1 Tax=Streptomyces toyocaensis TaxID=55952 RepID=UPI0007C7CB26|nr:LysR family transcriptional regulator [Streptomyces toyocaensis]
MVDIGWLESFLALVEHGSFTRAAEAQHVSQPAFSRRIRALEIWFGEPLVDRSTYPVSLTPAGVKVRAGAIETVAAISAVRDEIRGRQRTPRGAVRVAVTHTLATTFFAQWWASCSDQGPVPCVLLPSNTLDAYDALLHGGCDLLLAYADPALPLSIPVADVEWMVLAEDVLAPYTSVTGRQPDFSLPGTAAHPVPMVTHSQGAFLGRVTERILAERDLHLLPIAQSDFTSGLAALIGAGMGVGWLPGRLVTPQLADGTLQQVGDSSLTASIEIRLYRVPSDKVPARAAGIWHRAAGLAADGS